jgi:hypothetical protein
LNASGIEAVFHEDVLGRIDLGLRFRRLQEALDRPETIRPDFFDSAVQVAGAPQVYLSDRHHKKGYNGNPSEQLPQQGNILPRPRLSFEPTAGSRQ